MLKSIISIANKLLETIFRCKNKALSILVCLQSNLLSAGDQLALERFSNVNIVSVHQDDTFHGVLLVYSLNCLMLRIRLWLKPIERTTHSEWEYEANAVANASDVRKHLLKRINLSQINEWKCVRWSERKSV